MSIIFVVISGEPGAFSFLALFVREVSSEQNVRLLVSNLSVHISPLSDSHESLLLHQVAIENNLRSLLDRDGVGQPEESQQN